MQRVVFYSGGALSWAAASRTIERHGRDGLTLLFTDTQMEDGDLYRFLDDSERSLGVPITRITAASMGVKINGEAAGPTPWDVFRQKRMIGNTRMDPCSEMLKRKPAHAYLDLAVGPGATLVFGIDWTEMHRLDGLKRRYGEMGYAVEAPMCDAPWRSKSDVLKMMRAEGLEPPRLYAMGFAHNNCGGFCVRAGQGHFATLLRQMPERYAEHERREQELRDMLGKDVAILRDRTGGTTRGMPLSEFRQRQEVDEDEIGGCGCFFEPEPAKL